MINFKHVFKMNVIRKIITVALSAAWIFLVYVSVYIYFIS